MFLQSAPHSPADCSVHISFWGEEGMVLSLPVMREQGTSSALSFSLICRQEKSISPLNLFSQ